MAFVITDVAVDHRQAQPDLLDCYPLDTYYKQLPEAQRVREVKRELKE